MLQINKNKEIVGNLCKIVILFLVFYNVKDVHFGFFKVILNEAD